MVGALGESFVSEKIVAQVSRSAGEAITLVVVDGRQEGDRAGDVARLVMRDRDGLVAQNLTLANAQALIDGLGKAIAFERKRRLA